jgi:hypothetical protein
MLTRVALCAVAFWACGAGAAELPSREAKTKAPEDKLRTCTIGGEPGFVLPGGGCVHIGGYVSVGVSAGNLKH